jgi:hypothetical protein
MVQFSLGVHPEVFGSMVSVVELRRFPGIAKAGPPQLA